MDLDMTAPSPWAAGLSNRQAIRLSDLRDQVNRGALALTASEGVELAKLEWLLVEGLHGEALAENANRDRARLAVLADLIDVALSAATGPARGQLERAYALATGAGRR